jgi:hypothetical protein
MRSVTFQWCLKSRSTLMQMPMLKNVPQNAVRSAKAVKPPVDDAYPGTVISTGTPQRAARTAASVMTANVSIKKDFFIAKPVFFVILAVFHVILNVERVKILSQGVDLLIRA